MRKPPWLLWWEKSQLSRKPQSCGVEAFAQWSIFKNIIGKIAKFQYISINFMSIKRLFDAFLSSFYCSWTEAFGISVTSEGLSLISFSQILNCLFVIVFFPIFFFAFSKTIDGYFSIYYFDTQTQNKQQVGEKKMEFVKTKCMKPSDEQITYEEEINPSFKFSFSEEATKICAIFLMVWTFTK